jgi:FG-GAP-like repeat
MRKNAALLVIALLLLTPLALPVTGQQPKQGTQTPDQSRRGDVRKNVKPEAMEDGNDEPDADLYSPAGSTGMSRIDYMRRRDEMIGMWRGLPLPEGVPADARAQAIRQMERQELQLRQIKPDRGTATVTQQVNSTSWTQVGPAPIPAGQTTTVRNPVSGRVTSVAIHPTNPDIVYVGTAQGGTYRTLDGGTTWVPLMDSALSLAIGALAIDPNTPTTVWVGTGEGGFGGGQFFGVGLYRIRNADTVPILEGPFNTATNTANGLMANSRGITKILVNPNDSNVIFVATTSGANGFLTSGSVGLNTSPRGVYRSINALSAAPTFQKLNVNGATGAGTNPGLNTAASDMEFEPGNPNNLLVGINDSIGGGTDGVWRSTNALAADHTTVAFTKTLAGLCGFCETHIAINKLGPVVTAYAALESATGGEIRKSVDGGVTWSPSLPTATGFCGGQCFYDMIVAVDPSNPNLVLIGGSGDYDAFQTPNKRSVDGTNFAKASVGLHPDTHAIEFSPSNPLIVWHGNDGGIFKSTDGGATWTSMNNTGFSATQFVDISTHPTDRNFMIGGTQDNGTPFLQPENTWKLGDFGDGGFSLIDQNAIDTTNITAYHTYFNAPGLQVLFVRANNRSEIDPGATGWPTFHGCLSGSSNNGISCTDAVLFYAPMAQGPGNPNTIYFGAQKLYRSTDRGDTMPAVSQLFGFRVSAIGISPQNDNVRIVGGQNGALFGTSTGANPMVDLDPTNTVPNGFITRAIIDPNNPTTAYVTLAPFGLPAGGHVYKTTNLGNSGTTWTLSGTGIPDVPVNTIVVDPQNSNHLYAGTDIGVYRSTNAGASWQPFSDGLPRVAVFDMEFQARNNPGIRVLRIATHGRGIWQISIDPVQKKRGDFDTDGKTDVAIWNSSTGQWFILNSMSGFNRSEPSWGSTAANDIAVPRDYDGDNKVDVAVYRTPESNWYLLLSSQNTVSRTVAVRSWGNPGDIPVPGDYDGDGKTDLATFRPGDGNWHILRSSDNTTEVRQWGNSSDRLVPADYDKDGKTDIAVFRPSTGHWYIINSGNSSVKVVQWGNSTDKQVPADYDGDGKDDIAIYRPSESRWYIINSSNGSVTIQIFGLATDVPTPGDFDGDGISDLAVYRPSDGNWFIRQSSTNTVRVQNLGGTTPVPATYVP